MPAQFDELLGHATGYDALTDGEVSDLRQEITRDVVTELMFGPQRSGRETRRAGKADRAGIYLTFLSSRLLDSGDARTHLGRLVDDPTDAEGALRFACLLSLAQETDEAIWWWQFAAGAENATAAYCLYLLYLGRGELRDAEHWMGQALATGNWIDFVPPASWERPLIDARSAVFRDAVKRLKAVEVAGVRLRHPDHRFLEQVADHLMSAEAGQQYTKKEAARADRAQALSGARRKITLLRRG
ncbi:hypothetical protein [Streptomyces fuscichromogenes]|uniref:Uncharacterized protein n=1 Tax=Streptomyces fuscichromogenes TaxID=1324013 RepID=A0A917XPQ2_9ACTN|nr:hypothetical protein [Streptomyces fuscichromogenes]GGN45773.1 hypothetical protein GCM10011578_098020 [Streptomyces fuscichromogenes]